MGSLQIQQTKLVEVVCEMVSLASIVPAERVDSYYTELWGTELTEPLLTTFSYSVNGDPVIGSFLPQLFIQHMRCAQQRGRGWGHQKEQDRPTLEVQVLRQRSKSTTGDPASRVKSF